MPFLAELIFESLPFDGGGISVVCGGSSRSHESRLAACFA